MYEANGVGLAAPQVGVLRRVVVIDATAPADEDGEGEDGAGAGDAGAGDAANANADTGSAPAPAEPIPLKYTLINPEIVWASEEIAAEKEGCLSLPGITGTVERPARVRVRALDENGAVFEVEGEGLLAKALCHEIDHLNGILFIDTATEIEERTAEDE
ncbi:MAG: peptide deformylase, partial [Clostridiales Family XIII bacterium]|jgi:peptide deformylase|nr:peptide deformylase [Clostridiales Family XIII bacterium]